MFLFPDLLYFVVLAFNGFSSSKVVFWSEVGFYVQSKCYNNAHLSYNICVGLSQCLKLSRIIAYHAHL